MYEIQADVINLDPKKLKKLFYTILDSFEAAVNLSNKRLAYYYYGQLSLLVAINREFRQEKRYIEARRVANHLSSLEN